MMTLLDNPRSKKKNVKDSSKLHEPPEKNPGMFFNLQDILGNFIKGKNDNSVKEAPAYFQKFP